MMKCKWLSNLADKKLKKLGFKKVKNSNHIVQYQRYNEVFNYMQTVEVGHKKSGTHGVHSYVSGDANTSKEFNDSVMLTGIEMKWFLIKMISIGWYSKIPLIYRDDRKEGK